MGLTSPDPFPVSPIDPLFVKSPDVVVLIVDADMELCAYFKYALFALN